MLFFHFEYFTHLTMYHYILYLGHKNYHLMSIQVGTLKQESIPKKKENQEKRQKSLKENHDQKREIKIECGRESRQCNPS